MFLSADLNEKQQEFQLDEDESFHAMKVLRLSAGDEIAVTNGHGLVAECRIIATGKKQLTAEVVKLTQVEKPLSKVILGFCPVKKRDTIEWLMEKATEIGVDEVYLFVSEHSERTVVNEERLQKIIRSAVKQSMNPFPPQIHAVGKFAAMLEKCSKIENKYIACCKATEQQHLAKYVPKAGHKIILIGPEGGFSDREIEMAMKAGFLAVSLGKNRLRSETAALFGLSILKATGL